jgi:hypothetical protein
MIKFGGSLQNPIKFNCFKFSLSTDFRFLVEFCFRWRFSDDGGYPHGTGRPYAAGGVKKTIESHTSDDTLTVAESGSIHNNLGATGTVTLTLPASAEEGTMFVFAVQAAHELRIDPGTAAIRDDSGQTADKYKTADAIGECITLVADSNGDWVTIAKNGTWTEEA